MLMTCNEYRVGQEKVRYKNPKRRKNKRDCLLPPGTERRKSGRKRRRKKRRKKRTRGTCIQTHSQRVPFASRIELTRCGKSPSNRQLFLGSTNHSMVR
jgi:hypothetical protein